jgi:hypothetical protein
MKKLVDSGTAILKRATDILFVLNPRGTSVGAFVGVVMDGLFRAFGPALAKARDFVDLSNVNLYHLIGSGIVLFNLPAFLRRRKLPQDIEDAFEAIRRSRDSLTPVQVKSAYLRLCAEVVERVERKNSGTPDRPASV